MRVRSVTPAEINALKDNNMTVFDIREEEDWRREHIPGARSFSPASKSGSQDFIFSEQDLVVFHCQRGIRTEQNADYLVRAVSPARVLLMQGGIDAWKKAGFITIQDLRQPLPLIRQVHIAAGTLVLAGSLAGALTAPIFYVVPGVVGAGLLFAGLSGWCGMARLLSLMPWNQPHRSANK
ncbi:rhodanese family protein [Franconibacter pulveris]|uniref:rhodanese family protein n=1 Tax=Franconibacter pulveris TaxID=435910 RepID=UPI000496F247|nr:rhodanese family protein [Franconibacter pulveris]